MRSAVCTIFEGDFHKGVAVLINSLYKNGFRGKVYAGYRGSLPYWTNEAKVNLELEWTGAKTLQVTADLQIHFLPIDTAYHLTHYKPRFMLNLLNGPAKNADSLAFFDPDIVSLCKWDFYEKWMACGVAMVHEVVRNDMPVTHPNRIEWNNVIRILKRETRREIHSYINAGFCGILRQNIDFLEIWSEAIEVAIKEYSLNASTFVTHDKTSAFYALDQDTFNIAAMCCESPISEMGPEAMDFIGAGWTMSHATGWPKPWNKNFTLSALNGNPPNSPHKNYWNNISGQITLYGNMYTRLVRADLMVASLIGRFYRRN
jgi:hypothetical protein